MDTTTDLKGPSEPVTAATTTSGGGEPLGLRERKKRATRLALYERGLELFTAKGYTATTVNEIAAAADVAPRTFFSYFESKEALLFEPYESAFTSLQQRLTERPHAESALGELRRWLVEELPAEPAGGSAIDALLSEVSRDSPAVMRWRLRIIARIESHLARALTADLHSLPGDPTPDIAAAAVVGALYRVTLLPTTGQEQTLHHFDLALSLVQDGISGLR